MISRLLAVLVLLAAPALGQSIYEAGKNCTIQGGGLQDEPGRSCWRLEAATATFNEIADGLLQPYENDGTNYTLVCDECMVNELSVTGCAAEGDTVVRLKAAAAQIRGACILLSHRKQKLRNDNIQAAEGTPIPPGDFGGDPG